MAALKPASSWPEISAEGGARVLSLIRPTPTVPEFSIRDRIELDRWARAAAPTGISRIRLESADCGDPPWFGGFVLIYTRQEQWARWGLGPREDGMIELWCMADGTTLGLFQGIADALAAVAPV